MQRELCARITELLATVPIHDPFGYEALAKLKLPGMNYLEVLKLLHAGLKPKLYVEIGVGLGDSLVLAGSSTHCLAIDPSPGIWMSKTNWSLSRTSSDKFFYNEERVEAARGFDLAFIDGDHSCTQAARDFMNLEALAGQHSIIVINGVIPMDERTSTPEADTAFHTGDVWRLMAAIVIDRTDLIAFTIACPPAGLGIIGRFGSPPHYVTGIGDDARTAAQAASFPSAWPVAMQWLNIVDNHPGAWMAALQGQKAAA